MKQVLLVGSFIISSLAFGQYNENPPPELSQLTLEEKSWISTIGFPLKDYDFSDQSINFELSSAVKERRQGQRLTNISYGAMGLAGILMFAPYVVDDLEVNHTWSSLVLVGGLSLNLTGMFKKNKAKRRVENANFLYRE